MSNDFDDMGQFPHAGFSWRQKAVVLLLCLFAVGTMLTYVGATEAGAAEQLAERTPSDLLKTTGKVVHTESNNQSENRAKVKVGYTYTVAGQRYVGERWLSKRDFETYCQGDPTVHYSQASPGESWLVPPNPTSLSSTANSVTSVAHLMQFASVSGLVLLGLTLVKGSKPSAQA